MPPHLSRFVAQTGYCGRFGQYVAGQGRSGKLTELILARLPGRASLSIVMVTALIVAALVAVAFFLPARFMDVLWGNGSAAPAVSLATVSATAPAPVNPALTATVKPRAPEATPAAAAAPSTPKAPGDLIANTFQTIFAGPSGPSLERPAPPGEPAAGLTAALPAPTSAPRPTSAKGKGVVTRVVDTLVVRADPKTGAIEMPVAAPADNVAPPAPAAPVAAPPQTAAATPVPAADTRAAAPATPEAAPIPLAPPPALAVRPAAAPASIVASAKAVPTEAAKPATAKPERAPAASEFAVIGGKGVTVRSGPATAHSALFTLAAGKKVAVSGKEHGWLHITDADGRSGWLYSGLVQITKD